MVVACLPALALACAAPGLASATTAAELVLKFDSSDPDSQVVDVSSTGTAEVKNSVVRLNGGQLVPTSSRTGQGSAARFPKFDASSTGDRAIIRVLNAGTYDPFDPGGHPITWGADFKVDSVTVDATSGSTDNGNNLVQRGLAGSGHQYKLEVDGNGGKRPACRVETKVDHLLAVVPVTVESGKWYRATCQRTGDTLTGTVSRLDYSGDVVQTWSRTATYTGEGSLGGINFDDPGLPVSVGGKLRNDGTARTAGDQFNGVVDNVVIDVSR